MAGPGFLRGKFVRRSSHRAAPFRAAEALERRTLFAIPTITINDMAVTEGDAGTTTGTFTVTLSEASATPVTVDYGTNILPFDPAPGLGIGSAQAGVDYTHPVGTLTFAPGTTQLTIPVEVIGDATVEDDDMFNLVLSDPAGGTLARGYGVGRINDDDDPTGGAGGGVAFAISSPGRVPEGDFGTTAVTFNVTLSEPSATPVSVDFFPTELAMGGSPEAGLATEGVDYTGGSGTLVFQPGTTQLSFQVQVVGDIVAEPDDVFSISLRNPVGGTVTPTSGGDVKIADDDESHVIDAVDDHATVVSGQPVVINVRGNDLGLAGNWSQVTIATPPTAGSATANSDGTITYTPPAGSAQVDRFTYRVHTFGAHNSGHVTVAPVGAYAGPDPLAPDRTALFVTGDAGDNAFTFRRRGKTQVQVLIGKSDAGTFDLPTGNLVMFGGDGDDRLAVKGLKNPVVIYGGAGNDTLTGSKFNDLLVGGDGDDRINGGAGRDALVGGRGADALVGAADDDILVGGFTTYDEDSPANRAALRDLLATWTAADQPHDVRAAAIQSATGVGTSGAAFNNTTVTDDDAVDSITGVFNQDAIFANTTGGVAVDVIRGKRIAGNGIGIVADSGAWAPQNVLNVSVSAQQVGVTPKVIGFNQGYYLPGSSTSGWIDYSQLNGFRVWTSPGDFEPENSGTFGDGVSTLADFEARQAAVRANPENNGFVPWDIYNDRFENLEITGRNTSKLNYMLGELKARGITTIMQITRNESYPSVSNWDGAYEQWQHFYAMAYHVAKNYDVTRFQMYNEPDQTNATITQDEWRQRLKLASDAVRSAIEDVNRDFGKSLVADVSAPTIKLGAESALTWDTPGSVDWGKQALIENRTDYAGRTVDYDVFNTYDMHRYADSRPLDWYTRDGEILRSEIPQYNASGAMMPFTYTEYNRRSTAGFNNRPAESLDTPQMYTEFGLINLLTMEQGVQGLYAFKFNQTDFSGSPQKTGFYYVSEEGQLDTTGATRAADVQRLFTKGFVGELPRLATADAGENYVSAAALNASAGHYSYLGINLSDTDAAPLSIDLTSWDVQPGAVVTIEEVSEARHGEVVQTVTVPASKKLQLTQPARSVWLLTVPQGTPGASQSLTPAEDAGVRNGDATPRGSDAAALVARDPAGPGGDYATYLKFDLAGTNPADVSRAILQVTGRVMTGSGSSILHVYALTEDAWNEPAITWSTAPNLAGAADAKVANVGTTATPVGHLTFDASGITTTGIDLTDYLKNHAGTDGTLTLAIVREQRFTGDADANVVEVFTSESATPPRLTIDRDA